jgi:CheY-like chemotaxis protein
MISDPYAANVIRSRHSEPCRSASTTYLDAIPASNPGAGPAAGLLNPPHMRALHVLLVDDLAMNREIVASFLRAAGHLTTCVDSGAEAIAAVATTPFDIVLMDVRMPKLDGLETTRRIRALEGAHGQVPIVALTVQASPEQVLECRKSGMNGHLSKCFDLDTLLDTVVQTVEASTAGDTDAVAIGR